MSTLTVHNLWRNNTKLQLEQNKIFKSISWRKLHFPILLDKFSYHLIWSSPGAFKLMIPKLKNKKIIDVLLHLRFFKLNTWLIRNILISNIYLLFGFLNIYRIIKWKNKQKLLIKNNPFIIWFHFTHKFNP